MARDAAEEASRPAAVARDALEAPERPTAPAHHEEEMPRVLVTRREAVALGLFVLTIVINVLARAVVTRTAQRQRGA